ncbi:cupredoxin domain-containing protein [Cohnella hongkongensis]|uniref:Cupredoxin domain-containing protein n=1 Tax=Cohnella hongkongensis TaxID=178337 RepID=A0ABV9FI88_9BACL
MNKTRRLIALIGLAALFALGACGGNNANNGNNGNNAASPSPTVSPTAPAEGGGTGAGAGGANEVTIEATNWKFEPAEIRVRAGDTLKLTLHNTQGAHGIEISDLNVKIKNNETKELKLDQPGSYEFHCSIQCGQGHDAMTGFIIVE